ncbi:MAG: hypothetical protein ABI412_05450 [Sphingomicrobium sp.]
MLTLIMALTGQAAVASSPVSAPTPIFYPNANELFDRDEVLRGWAVRRFDRNRDGWLTLYEAQPALAAFKEIADSDSDGRITTAEYRRARQFVFAR